MEVDMFLTAKLNLMSGMFIGAAAVMAMKQVCKMKQRKKHQETSAPVAASDWHSKGCRKSGGPGVTPDRRYCHITIKSA